MYRALYLVVALILLTFAGAGAPTLAAANVVVGLLDGFNPCSMWVLIPMISMSAKPDIHLLVSRRLP